LEDGYSDESSSNGSGTNDIQDMLTLLGISAIIALLLSSGELGVMIRHAELLIKVALLFNVICTGLFAIGSFFISPFSAIIGLVLFILTVYYSYIVWG
jgi:CHASE2 domain-containing sensor protein